MLSGALIGIESVRNATEKQIKVLLLRMALTAAVTPLKACAPGWRRSRSEWQEYRS
jgi:hypothetical protein